MSTHQEKVEIRKTIAQDALRREIEKGKQVMGVDGIKRFLQEFAQKSDFKQDYFEILEDKHCFDVYIAASSRARSVSGGRPDMDILTPPASEISGETHSEQRLPSLGIAESQDMGKEELQRLSYDDPDNYFYVKMYHASRDDILPATANRIKGEESYIAERTLNLHNLSGHMDSNDTIELKWVEHSGASTRTRRTRFRKISNTDIENDIAIAQGAYNSCDTESVFSGDMQLSFGHAESETRMTELTRAEFFKGAGEFSASFYASLMRDCEKIPGLSRKRFSQCAEEIPGPDFLNRNKRPRVDGPGG